jgi:hypothetical protein
MMRFLSKKISCPSCIGLADGIVHLLVAAGTGPTALARLPRSALEFDSSFALVGPVLDWLKLLQVSLSAVGIVIIIGVARSFVDSNDIGRQYLSGYATAVEFTVIKHTTILLPLEVVYKHCIEFGTGLNGSVGTAILVALHLYHGDEGFV